MIKDNKLLTIIVRMSESKQSGDNQSIPWQDQETSKKQFFEKIALRLKQDLQREVNLHIKKSKHLADIASESTFTATGVPPVYIIDLTENDPTIFFELGILWNMKNSIIVLVSQNIADLKFNASGIDVILYSNNPTILEQAVSNVVMNIKNTMLEKKFITNSNIIKANNSLNEKYVTELYHSNSNLSANPSAASMQSQKMVCQSSNRSTRQTHGWVIQNDLMLPQTALDRASSAKDPDHRLLLYQMTLQLNPTFLDAYLSLAREQRKQSRYDEALATFQQAITLFPADANLYREQGLTYSKSGQLEKAIASFRMALTLNHRDEEGWNVLGGLLRRIGTRSTSYNWEVLHDARESYKKAIDLNDRNTYAQGNLARLDLLLSKIEPERFSLVREELDTLELLCRLDLKKDPKDYWRWLDWAECYLLSGKLDESCQLYTRAIELMPLEYRKSELATVIPPLTHILLSNVLPNDAIKNTLQTLLEDFNLLMSGQISTTNLRSIGIQT